MKKHRVLFLITMLIFALVACQTASSGDNTGTEPDPQNSFEAEPSNSYNGEWPIPEGAYLINETERFLHFQVDMSLNEVMDFYLTELHTRGYKDRPISSDYDGSDGIIDIVFDGHESGRQILVVMHNLNNNGVNVEIGLADL